MAADILSESKQKFTRRIIAALLFTAAAFLLFMFCSRDVFESDTFLHLSTGKLIVETHGVPREDPFSYANAGKDWVNHESLSQVLFYGLHLAGGYAALVVYSMVMVLIAFLFAALAAGNARYPLTLSVLLILAIVTASERFQVRPEVHSLALIGAFIFILERYRSGRSSRLVWLLPLLQVLWENLHGGTLLGIEIAGAYLAGEVISIIARRVAGWPDRVIEAAKVKRLAMVFGLIILGSLINPWGPMTLILPFRLQTHSFAMSEIIEWQRTYGLFSQFHPLPVSVYPWLLGISGLSYILNYRKVSLSQVFIFLGFGLMSLLARRNMALLALVAVPYSYQNLSEVYGYYSPRFLARLGKYRLRFPALAGSATIAAALFIFIITAFLCRDIATNRYYEKNRYLFRFGYGLSSMIYPWGLFDFMDKIELDGPGFNNHDLGGFMIWREYPRYKVFLDCRSSIYDPDYLAEYFDAMRSPAGFRIVASKYGLNFAAILHIAHDSSGAVSILYNDPGWALVYLDQAAALFVRDIAANREVIRQHGLDLAGGDGPSWSVEKPSAFDYANVAGFFRSAGLFEKAEEYFKTAVSLSPGNALFLDNLANLQISLGRLSDAIVTAEKAVEFDPSLAEARITLADAYLYTGRFKDALKEYDTALAVESESSAAWCNRGAALLELGREREALESFEKALAIEPSHLSAGFNRALTLERLGDGRAESAWREYIVNLKRTGAPLEDIREAEAHLAGRDGG